MINYFFQVQYSNSFSNISYPNGDTNSHIYTYWCRTLGSADDRRKYSCTVRKNEIKKTSKWLTNAVCCIDNIVSEYIFAKMSMDGKKYTLWRKRTENTNSHKNGSYINWIDRISIACSKLGPHLYYVFEVNSGRHQTVKIIVKLI